MTEDCIAEIDDLHVEPNTKPYSGMYFNEAIFFFAIDSENKRVNLEFSVGPRYGRGYLYDINNAGQEKILINEQNIWVS